VACLEDAHCQDSVGPYCQPIDHVCAQCTRNAHCPGTATCNPIEFVCQDGFTPCGECSANRECQPGSVCWQFELGGSTKIDFGCLRTCLDGSDCTQGYACQTAQESGVCLPNYNAETPTCQAIRDMFAGTQCVFDEACGVEAWPDGVCARDSQIEFGLCSVPCLDSKQCPGERLECVFESGSREGLCAPVGFP
jgi:hypothetical protein